MTPRQLGLRPGDIVQLTYHVRALFVHVVCRLSANIDPLYTAVHVRYERHAERYISPLRFVFIAALIDFIQTTTFKRGRYST